MNTDNYSEIINGEETYTEIAKLLKEGKSVLIGWTDELGSHFDILFTLGAERFGSQIQGGIKANDLFVSIMRIGCFGFKISSEKTHYGYYAEKLNLGSDATTKKLAELINRVKKRIYTKGQIS